MEQPPKSRFWKSLKVTLAILVPLSLIAAIAVPSLLRSRITANEAQAIATMRTINTAQQQYKTGETGSRYGLLSTLSAIGDPPYLDPEIGSGTKSGYTFTCVVGAAGQSYSVRAGPIELNVTGNRYFFTNSGAVIFHGKGPEMDNTSHPNY